MRVKLLVSYNGSFYQGWQKQPKTSRTVQGVLEAVFERLFCQKIPVTGASRTDAGVHALHQVAHCDIPPSPRLPVPRLQKSLNALLPPSVRIRQIWKVPADFHALRSSVRKTYLYFLDTRKVFSPFHTDRLLWYPYPVCLSRLERLSPVCVGTKDFTSFQNAGGAVKSPVRTVCSARWLKKGAFLTFCVTGNGFLKQMVRNLVGTQLELCRRGLGPAQMKSILQARDRKKAFQTAPAAGLYLGRIYYPPALDRQCKKL